MLNPELKRLDVLAGHWEVEISNTSFLPDPGATLKGTSAIEWLDEGAFLVVREGEREAGPPNSVSVVGRDGATRAYTRLYFDDRGVSRIYQMSLEGNEWKQWRDSPGFSQRFTGTISDDKNTITARWEKSEDGSSWEHDFDMTYKKVR